MYKSERKPEIVSHIILLVLAITCIVPFVILISSSLTSESALLKEGYSILPQDFNVDAYRYLIQNASLILRSYGITIFVTIFGTTLSLIVTALLAYGLSRKELPYGNVLAFIVFFTLLFNGGLVPSYLVYTEIFNIKNTIWALIFPNLFMNGFNVLLMRTFFITSIPEPIIESARIDGAGEFKIFSKIVFPLSMPILATIGLLQTILYWNDWNNGLIYLTDPNLFNIQNVLYEMMMNIQFLASSNMGNSAIMSAAETPSTSIRMAIAVIGVLPIIIAYPFFQKYLVKGITLGSVKG